MRNFFTPNIVKFISIAVLALVSWHTAGNLNFSDIKPIMSILQNGSAMVFTIMGIWVAYVYPVALLQITQPSTVSVKEASKPARFSRFNDPANSDNDLPIEDFERIQLMIRVIIQSAIIFSALILVFVAKAIIVSTGLTVDYLLSIKRIGVFVIYVLTFFQLESIYIVIASNVNFIIDLKNKMNAKLNARKLD